MPLQNMLLAMLFGFFFHSVMKQLVPVIHLFKIHKLITIQSQAFTNLKPFFFSLLRAYAFRGSDHITLY